MSASQGLHAKRARVALGGSSLPDPQALVSPPTTGLQVGKPRSKKRPGKNKWVWQQFTKVTAPKAAGAAEGEQAGVSSMNRMRRGVRSLWIADAVVAQRTIGKIV